MGLNVADQHVASRASATGLARSAPIISRTALIVALVVTDALAIGAAFAVAYLLRFKSHWELFYTNTSSPLRFYSTLVFLMIPLVILVFACYRLYALQRNFDGYQEYAGIASAGTLAMMAVVLLSFLFDSSLVVSRGWIVMSWAALLSFVALNRFAMRRVMYGLRRRGAVGQRVLLVGGGSDVADLSDRIRETPASGLQVVDVFDPAWLDADDEHDGGPSSFRIRINSLGVDSVIVSQPSVSQLALSRIVRELSDTSVDLQLVPGMYEILTTGVQVREIRGLPLVTMNKVRITGLDYILKRALDYTVATGLLLLLSPILIGIAIAVKLGSPGPVLHRRRVVGQGGQRFHALKFRTMYVNGAEILQRQPELAEILASEGKLVDDPRITRTGRWLRRWSLDELPQLLNVLRGQMSLVGPRMLAEEELQHFGHWRENVSTVKPGLTGLWQVSGRSRLGYDDRVRLDMQYIRGYSIWFDIEIMLRTIPAVLRGVGAY